jgi:hypothetical protein
MYRRRRTHREEYKHAYVVVCERCVKRLARVCASMYRRRRTHI